LKDSIYMHSLLQKDLSVFFSLHNITNAQF